MKKYTYSIFASLVILVFFISCAKLGSPPGGEKDEVPPVVEKSKPLNYSTYYSRQKVEITFDEFITLENVFNEFTISPPLEEKPMPYTRGKSIVVDLKSAELDSATYTLDFGQAIEDLNEGNKLPNYQFVVSILSYIDSFSVRGKVVNAFDLKPGEESILVFLYENLSDTAPYKVIPSYLGRTNPEGNFKINHVKPGIYNVFALQDLNNNLLFDMPNEVIAYYDEKITLHPDSFPVIKDTINNLQNSEMNDSSFIVEVDSTVKERMIDSIPNDSSQVADTVDILKYGYSFNLYSFQEIEPYNQNLIDYSREVPEKLVFIFDEKLKSPPELRLLNPDTTGTWYILEKNKTMDTLSYWLADSNLVMNDSIVIEITHPRTDSMGIDIPFTDTILFRQKKQESKGSKKDKKGGGFGLGMLSKGTKNETDTLPEPIPRFKITSNIKSSGHNLNVPIKIYTEAPIVENNAAKIEVFRLDDTLEIPVKFKFDRDSSNLRTFNVIMNYESETRYRLKLYEGLFTDNYGRTIDSTVIPFSTQSEDYYGTINVDIKNDTLHSIVQLLDEKEKVVRVKYIFGSEKVKFDFLSPAGYSIKIIIDNNNNKTWDTGNYKLKMQPEKVYYFPQKVDVRSNWEVEYIWEIKNRTNKIVPPNSL